MTARIIYRATNNKCLILKTIKHKPTKQTTKKTEVYNAKQTKKKQQVKLPTGYSEFSQRKGLSTGDSRSSLGGMVITVKAPTLNSPRLCTLRQGAEECFLVSPGFSISLGYLRLYTWLYMVLQLSSPTLNPKVRPVFAINASQGHYPLLPASAIVLVVYSFQS